MAKRTGWIFVLWFVVVLAASGQTGTIQRFCDNGGNHSLTSSLPSSNFMQGNIPYCTVSVYYHDSTTLAPIFASENSTGTVQSAQVTEGGSYSVCPTGVTFTGGGGSGAAAAVSCTNGSVVSVAITNPGSGYTTAPTISFSGGTGSGAAATATIVGDLTNPFTANVDGSYLFWAAVGVGYDIVMSGGYAPNQYSQPRTIDNIFPNAYGGTAYTIIQSNGTASAPTSPVNFINSSTVDFSISANQISAAVIAGSVLAIEKNGVKTSDQSLLNFCDNGGCGTALPAGMQQVYEGFDSNGGVNLWTQETAVAQNITPVYQVPTAGQHIIMLPNSCTESGTAWGDSVCGAAPGYSLTNVIHGNGTLTQLTTTDTGWAYNGVLGLPSFVSAANVTAVYGGVTSWWTGGSKTAGTCGGPNFDTWNNGTSGFGPGLSANWPYTATNTVTEIDGGSPATFNYTTGYFALGNQQSTGCSGTSTRVALPYLVVYYTGTAPPATTNLAVNAPLSLVNNTLGLQWPLNEAIDTGSSTAYAISIPWMTTANLTAGADFWVIPANTNTTTNPTLNLNGWGTIAILGNGAATIALNDIVQNRLAHFVYGADGNMHLENPQTGSGGGGTTTNALTAAASGGAAPGTTFNGSAAVTFDYHSFGAPGISGSPTTGNCVDWASANTLGDTGAPCGSGGGGSAFSALTSGTNTTAAMGVGSGASLTVSGTGTLTPDTISIDGTVCDVVWKNSAGTVVKIELFACTAITDYANGATTGSLEWAINQLGTNGGLVLMHPGIYNISEAVLIDWDWITIEGTQLPFWSGPGSAWPTHQTPGAPGGAQIVTTGAGSYSTFSIGNTSAHMHGNTRHQGIEIRRIYGYGAYLTGTSFITDVTPTQLDDRVVIDDNIMQGYTNCVIIDQWDYHEILNNSIQSNAGAGVCEAGGGPGSAYGLISGNVFYDNGGEGVTITGGINTIISGNRFGDLPDAGTISGGTGEFIDNVFGGTMSGAPLNLTATGWTVRGPGISQFMGTNGGGPMFSQAPQATSGTYNLSSFVFADSSGTTTSIPIAALAPSIANGNYSYTGVGKSLASNNFAMFGLYYAGNGSSSNFGCLQLYAAPSCSFSFWPTSNIGIGYGPTTGAPPSLFSVNSSVLTAVTVTGSSTSGTQFVLSNSTTGAHQFNFYTNGSAGGAGYGGVFDNTANADAFSFEGGSSPQFNLDANGVFGFTSSTTRADQAPDTGLSRDGAGVVDVGNGTKGNKSGTIAAATFQAGVIYSAAGTALPSCAAGNKGQEAVVSDATSPTYLGAYTSGGAVVTPVMCNGSGWVTY
ncbi:MAG TPA: right-handed parallel beta-helix repeat-containing protein [Candidatus Acidoferrales bacterium]|nr:right-handed parallel beta-helix repeat-containing protein [Candidatus Acidoferrales bacterium]